MWATQEETQKREKDVKSITIDELFGHYYHQASVIRNESPDQFFIINRGEIVTHQMYIDQYLHYREKESTSASV